MRKFAHPTPRPYHPFRTGWVVLTGRSHRLPADFPNRGWGSGDFVYPTQSDGIGVQTWLRSYVDQGRARPPEPGSPYGVGSKHLAWRIAGRPSDAIAIAFKRGTERTVTAHRTGRKPTVRPCY